MEAWIEIIALAIAGEPLNVASFMEAWIEIFSISSGVLEGTCRLLHGGVDWNIKAKLYSCSLISVASFMEAWIEIFLAAVVAVVLFVASFMEAWIEIFTTR